MSGGGTANTDGSLHTHDEHKANGTTIVANHLPTDKAAPLLVDVYEDSEISAIHDAFAPIATVHQELMWNIDTLERISGQLNALLCARSTVEPMLAQTPPIDGRVLSLQSAFVGAHAGNVILLSEINKYIYAIRMRISLDRMNIYARLSKVPSPLVPVHNTTQCDDRCELGISAGGGSLSRQRCCGAYVCSACLYFYNFEKSNQARHYHAHCFKCGKLRGIFKHLSTQQQPIAPPPPTK